MSYVLLWSQSQNVLHVEPLADMLSSNREAYAENRECDFVPLVIGTEADVRRAADACRNTLHQREERRERVTL